LSRGISSRVTYSPSADLNPIWSPDGQQIVFASNRKGPYDLYLKSLTGTGNEELILESSNPKLTQDWTRDGRFILYSVAVGSNRDLWLLPTTGDQKPQPVATTPQLEDQAQISPDGRWVAYISDESGRWEVYVQPLQGAGEKLRVSSNGGGQPKWRGDGRELFYLALDGTMMAVPIQAGAVLVPGSPTSLFQTGISPSPGLDQYAVTADGQRFLVITPLPGEAASPITVIQNWPAALNRQ
jgi:Tol biopolymer transport system component